MHGKIAWERPLDALKLPLHTRGLLLRHPLFPTAEFPLQGLGSHNQGEQGTSLDPRSSPLFPQPAEKAVIVSKSLLRIQQN